MAHRKTEKSRCDTYSAIIKHKVKDKDNFPLQIDLKITNSIVIIAKVKLQYFVNPVSRFSSEKQENVVKSGLHYLKNFIVSFYVMTKEAKTFLQF